jgi:hypothetical protein
MILAEWLRKIPWIHSGSDGRISARPTAPRASFTPVELAVIASLEVRGNLALNSEVMDDCSKAGFSGPTAQVTLVSSVFTRQVLWGMYALRGRNVDRWRLSEAVSVRSQRKSEVGRAAVAGSNAAPPEDE